MWESLEQMRWVTFLGTTGWLYATVSVIHYATFFFFIGTVVLVDLRILGLANSQEKISKLSNQVLPLAWIGFSLATISGFLLFTTDAGDYAPDKLFRVKLLLIALAFISTVAVQSGVRTWDQLPVVPPSAKIMAFSSLMLWIAAILASVAIPAISGLG